MSAETDIAAVNDGGANTAAEVRTAFTSVLTAFPTRERYWQERQPGETAHADDLFFDGSSPSGTEINHATGSVNWTEGDGVLGCVFDDQLSGDLEAMVWPLTPSAAPVTLELGIAGIATRHVASSMVGVLFTDGTANTDNAVALALYQQNGPPMFARFVGTLGAMTTTNLGTVAYHLNAHSRLRLAWTAANTWDFSLSGPIGPFTDFGFSGFSSTMTPTHYGVFVSAWGSGFPAAVAFRYLRVTEANLA